MKYNGKSIIKQSAVADLSISKLADEKNKYSHYEFSMPHLVLYEICGAHILHHLDAPLSDLTQEHFPYFKVSLHWEHSGGNSMAVHLASLVGWQGAKGRKEPHIYFFARLSAKRAEGQEAGIE